MNFHRVERSNRHWMITETEYPSSRKLQSTLNTHRDGKSNWDGTPKESWYSTKPQISLDEMLIETDEHLIYLYTNVASLTELLRVWKKYRRDRLLCCSLLDIPLAFCFIIWASLYALIVLVNHPPSWWVIRVIVSFILLVWLSDSTLLPTLSFSAHSFCFLSPSISLILFCFPLSFSPLFPIHLLFPSLLFFCRGMSSFRKTEVNL